MQPKGGDALEESNILSDPRDDEYFIKILNKYEKSAEKGQIIKIYEIKEEYEKKCGHKIGAGTIYRVLKRHNWRKVMPRSKHPKKADDKEIEKSKKKLKLRIDEIKKDLKNKGRKKIRLMFQDEAGFGRINKPKYCWCKKGIRPSVPCHHIREYRYAYGAVEPVTGEKFFLIMPYCNTVCMNLFLEKLSKTYSNDYIIMAADGAAWHKSKELKIPENIEIFHIPPYTPEMNPVEQIWRELRTQGFKNELFTTLEKVVDRLCDTINSLSNSVVKSITNRNWISEMLKGY